MVRLYTIKLSLGPTQIIEVNSRIRGIGGIGKDLTKMEVCRPKKGEYSCIAKRGVLRIARIAIPKKEGIGLIRLFSAKNRFVPQLVLDSKIGQIRLHKKDLCLTVSPRHEREKTEK